MSLEISSVTGVQNIGGFNQPTIGQRRIEHEARLKDGEVNLIAGILNDTETNSLSGYPGLLKVPILKNISSARRTSNALKTKSCSRSFRTLSADTTPTRTISGKSTLGLETR